MFSGGPKKTVLFTESCQVEHIRTNLSSNAYIFTILLVQPCTQNWNHSLSDLDVKQTIKNTNTLCFLNVNAFTFKL